MHTKRFALILVSIFIIFLLSGCYDLGDGVESDSEYCSVFENVTLYDSNGNEVKDYKMSDFYNPDAVNSFASPIPYDKSDKFMYMSIGVAKDLTIGEFAVYFNSKNSGTLSVSLFLLDVDELPTKIMTKTNEVTERECNEPTNDKIIASASVYLLDDKDDWDSIMIKNWKISDKETSKKLSVKSGQYLVLRFDNNYYDFETREYDKVKESFEKIKAEYDSAKIDYDDKYADYNSGSEEISKEELIELKTALDKLEKQFKEEQSKLELAKFNYESLQEKNLEEMDIRITAILINTGKGA